LIKHSTSLGQFNSSYFALFVKKLDPRITVIGNNNSHKLFSQFNVLTENRQHNTDKNQPDIAVKNIIAIAP